MILTAFKKFEEAPATRAPRRGHGPGKSAGRRRRHGIDHGLVPDALMPCPGSQSLTNIIDHP